MRTFSHGRIIIIIVESNSIELTKYPRIEAILLAVCDRLGQVSEV